MGEKDRKHKKEIDEKAEEVKKTLSLKVSSIISLAFRSFYESHDQPVYRF